MAQDCYLFFLLFFVNFIWVISNILWSFTLFLIEIYLVAAVRQDNTIPEKDSESETEVSSSTDKSTKRLTAVPSQKNKGEFTLQFYCWSSSVRGYKPNGLIACTYSTAQVELNLPTRYGGPFFEWTFECPRNAVYFHISSIKPPTGHRVLISWRTDHSLGQTLKLSIRGANLPVNKLSLFL